MTIVYAKSTMSVGGAHGGIYDLKAGEPYRSDHPAVVSHPECFSDSPTWAHSSRGFEVVEQATAAPGEKRRGR